MSERNDLGTDGLMSKATGAADAAKAQALMGVVKGVDTAQEVSQAMIDLPQNVTDWLDEQKAQVVVSGKDRLSDTVEQLRGLPEETIAWLGSIADIGAGLGTTAKGTAAEVIDGAKHPREVVEGLALIALLTASAAKGGIVGVAQNTADRITYLADLVRPREPNLGERLPSGTEPSVNQDSPSISDK